MLRRLHTIWLTLRCNNACLFCPQQAIRGSWKGDFFSKETILERIFRESVPHHPIAFVGGEPTIHPDLFEFVRAARATKASSIIVQTNGRRLAYIPYTRGLVASGVSALDISLHGATATIHDFHTGTPGSFAQTLSGLGVARGAGLRFGVTSVLTRSNYRHIADLVRLVAIRGAQALHLTTVQELPGGPQLLPALLPSHEMMEPYLADALRIAQDFNLKIIMDPTHPSDQTLFAGIGKVSPDQ